MIPKTMPTVAPASTSGATAEFALATTGAEDGAEVDGAAVGTDVDGAFVGTMVGAVDGAVVGTMVGAIDGAVVGTMVGAVDGAVDGAPVHAVGLHACDALPRPLQSAPVPTGVGFEHDRVWVPPPHATEHAPHAV